MTKLLRISLVVAAVVAATTSGVVAQTRGERAGAFTQDWNEQGGPVRTRTRIIMRDQVHNPMNDVYSGRHYIGSDPSAQIRNELLRDAEQYNR